ncbi:helix-turn-helix domain-containing protein [Nocardioides lianchengensis]|uniref:Regulatory protein, tetR family n=1 Tax=Nocardioides lianchengensis TaxID=1045774 RepID=A0A1G6RLW3_9ACTN|nr:TetR/AcrR family transcriptional regulator [Nocardioides lianchengensis]NYG10187.1 AcrR family transcriptional regulator [Nocardioides lianchengensis]SDD05642.1 regulatory protein, tetR family [Nocardioides lianchengensis]
MPRLLDTNTRTDELAHTLARLIDEGGLEAPSSRRIAAEIKLSIASLYHHYESRERLLRVLSYRIGLALVDACQSEVRATGVGAMLRDDEDGIMLTRAWLGVVELGRRDEHVGNSVAAVAEREQSMLYGAAGDRCRDPEQVELVQALLHGLRAATTRYCDPLDVGLARRILVDAV